MPKKLSTVKRTAWDTFSKFIRKRDGKCVTCGAVQWDETLGEWSTKGFQAGHFHHNVLDFDEININCQCVQCNKYKHGNLAKYAEYLLEKYGLEEFNKLSVRASMALKGEKHNEAYYEEKIRIYKDKLSKL